MGIFNKKTDMHTANTSVLRIVLEHSGTMLYELNTAEYAKEIIIGRGAGCTWTLEGIDSSASSRHAVISKRKNNFYVTDLGSRNGIYFQNKRISERKLALGDRISLGECTIIVEACEEKNKRISQFHRLEYMDAKGHKTTIDINKAQMIIGSAPTCDIIFQNQLISSQHAALLLRSDGSCWIRDLNSRNGTSVNNMELTMDGERMLQDNDVINIAYLEIRFLDAAVEHHDSRLWPTVITLAITVLVIMAGYIGYLKLTPNSKQILKMAVTEINKGSFDKAKSLLDTAARAAGAGAYEHQYDDKRLGKLGPEVEVQRSVARRGNYGGYRNTRVAQGIAEGLGSCHIREEVDVGGNGQYGNGDDSQKCSHLGVEGLLELQPQD